VGPEEHNYLGLIVELCLQEGIYYPLKIKLVNGHFKSGLAVLKIKGI